MVPMYQRVSCEEGKTIQQGRRLGSTCKGEFQKGNWRKEGGGLHETMTLGGKPEGREGGTWDSYGVSVPEGSSRQTDILGRVCREQKWKGISWESKMHLKILHQWNHLSSNTAGMAHPILKGLPITIKSYWTSQPDGSLLQALTAMHADPSKTLASMDYNYLFIVSRLTSL